MNWEQIAPALAALVIAIIGYIITYFDNKKVKSKLKTIEEALQSDDMEYYIVCPHCQQKICLSKVKLFSEKKTKENELKEE